MTKEAKNALIDLLNNEDHIREAAEKSQEDMNKMLEDYKRIVEPPNQEE